MIDTNWQLLDEYGSDREPEWPMSAASIDVAAPYELALATVSVREALAGPTSDTFLVAGSCQYAGRALALGLRRRGWNAVCLPGECVDDHLVVLVDGWVLDPTAEQFGGTGGPWLCRLPDLPNSSYELELWVEECFEPEEYELTHMLAALTDGEPLLKVCGLDDLIGLYREIDARLYEERVRAYEDEP